MGSNPSLRASDAERDSAAAQLRDHYADGRLDVDEFRERLDRVYTARTHGELDHALVDLPRAPLPGAMGMLAQMKARSDERRRERYRRGWIRFLWVNTLCWSVWALQALGSFGHRLPLAWPLIITVPWAIRRVLRTPRGTPELSRSPSVGSS
jgi:hypothetical protein